MALRRLHILSLAMIAALSANACGVKGTLKSPPPFGIQKPSETPQSNDEGFKETVGENTRSETEDSLDELNR